MNIVGELFVPQASPKLKVARHAEAIASAIDSVLRGDSFVLGRHHTQFEHEFAAYLGSQQCVGVSSGTDALVLALQALDVGPNDHVLVPAMSAPATAAAVLRVGAKIRFVDIEPSTRAVDPQAIASRVTKQTKAIVLVHLHGIPAAVVEVMDIARRLGLPVIEDCAQAQGILVNGRHVGTFGDLAAFSFYPTKNLGCLGDGGCVVTQSAQLADRVRRLKNYGLNEQGQCVEPGLNHRLDEMQAAILRLLLPHLDEENNDRKAFAKFYDALFSELGYATSLPPSPKGTVFHQYAITVERRDLLIKWLRRHGVGTNIHYFLPLHRHPAFAEAAVSEPYDCFPAAEELARTVLSLPIQSELRVHEAKIGEAIRQSLAAMRD